MAIKMRVNNTKESVCKECGCPYSHTAEMYDLALCGERYTLCRSCIEVLFQKTLKASCMYNGKVKGPEDLKREGREQLRKGGKV